MKLPPALTRKVLALAGEASPRRPVVPPAAVRRLAVEVDVPVKTASEANIGGRTPARIARKVAVKLAVQAALPRLQEPGFPLPAVVTLTRVSGGKLDDDNLRPALKAVRDVVADWLGLDDADGRVRWVYRQRPGWSPAVRIRIEHGGAR